MMDVKTEALDCVCESDIGVDDEGMGVDIGLIFEDIFNSDNPDNEVITLEADADGNIFIDKDLHPQLYEWAVNG